MERVRRNLSMHWQPFYPLITLTMLDGSPSSFSWSLEATSSQVPLLELIG